MPRPLANGKYMADVRLPDGSRARKVFNTLSEATQFEANPQTDTLSPKVDTVFRHGFDYMWKGSKNHAGQWQHVQELTSLIGRDTLCSAITTMRVQDVVLSLRNKGNSDATIKRKLVTLSMLMKHAVSRGAASAVPEFNKKALREGRGRTRFLTPDEYQRIREAMPREDFRMFSDFLLWTGGRYGECQIVDWFYVGEQHVTFAWQTTKGAKTRTIPLVQGAAEAIQWSRSNAAETSSGPWKDIAYNTFERAFAAAKVRAGLGGDPEIVPHTLRHTCASWMVQDGVGIEVVQQWLGHSEITTTMRYAHLAPNALDKAASVLSKRGTDQCPYSLPNDCHDAKPVCDGITNESGKRYNISRLTLGGMSRAAKGADCKS